MRLRRRHCSVVDLVGACIALTLFLHSEMPPSAAQADTGAPAQHTLQRGQHSHGLAGPSLVLEARQRESASKHIRRMSAPPRQPIHRKSSPPAPKD
eukprot:CAMPEP_0172162094 /NCGR_PEP_ID=MMETSP1050-20130122/6478_1 /TAXON_ID=233186 /ORGANISM="Cryptomonas curvata, Strain CCAP979/52" /LENGTH=95 /DNA_ID=CAMNT_0012832041 /DNA_START=535 /DNA_END=822 /DNA_ORIENTATION=+